MSVNEYNIFNAYLIVWAEYELDIGTFLHNFYNYLIMEKLFS